MQKRFCTCGHMVLVHYHRVGDLWRPQVLTSGKVRRKSSQIACPACGAPLNIHTLR